MRIGKYILGIVMFSVGILIDAYINKLCGHGFTADVKDYISSSFVVLLFMICLEDK